MVSSVSQPEAAKISPPLSSKTVTEKSGLQELKQDTKESIQREILAQIKGFNQAVSKEPNLATPEGFLAYLKTPKGRQLLSDIQFNLAKLEALEEASLHAKKEGPDPRLLAFLLLLKQRRAHAAAEHHRMTAENIKEHKKALETEKARTTPTTGSTEAAKHANAQMAYLGYQEYLRYLNEENKGLREEIRLADETIARVEKEMEEAERHYAVLEAKVAEAEAFITTASIEDLDEFIRTAHEEYEAYQAQMKQQEEGKGQERGAFSDRDFKETKTKAEASLLQIATVTIHRQVQNDEMYYAKETGEETTSIEEAVYALRRENVLRSFEGILVLLTASENEAELTPERLAMAKVSEDQQKSLYLPKFQVRSEKTKAQQTFEDILTKTFNDKKENEQLLSSNISKIRGIDALLASMSANRGADEIQDFKSSLPRLEPKAKRLLTKEEEAIRGFNLAVENIIDEDHEPGEKDLDKLRHALHGLKKLENEALNERVKAIEIQMRNSRVSVDGKVTPNLVAALRQLGQDLVDPRSPLVKAFKTPGVEAQEKTQKAAYQSPNALSMDPAAKMRGGK